jgi:excisionase family DNA binding protein
MRSLHFHVSKTEPAAVVDERVREMLKAAEAAIRELRDAGESFDFKVEPVDGWITPATAAAQLGVSRQHVRRLMDAGELHGQKKENSTHWLVSQGSVTAALQRRGDGLKIINDWSRQLDELGAPPE